MIKANEIKYKIRDMYFNIHAYINGKYDLSCEGISDEGSERTLVNRSWDMDSLWLPSYMAMKSSRIYDKSIRDI